MARTQILATGSTLATSSEITVAAGEAVTVSLKDIGGPVKCNVQIKDDANLWVGFGSLTGSNPTRGLFSPGVYRVLRPAGQTCGVFTDA